MQKVVGSNPIIRLAGKAAVRAFLFSEEAMA
jgi:hypothetical protein